MSIAIDANKPLINLSGPSVAALNGMLWCVNAVIAKFMGTKPYQFPVEKAVLDEDFNGPGFMEMLRMYILRRDKNGVLHAKSAGRSLSANGFYISVIGEKEIPAGSTIDVCLLCPASEY
jgi:molybdopterin molybdotransferase